MRTVFALILIVLSCSNCSNDNGDGIDCALFDPAFPTLFLKLVGANNTNLFENGTLNPNDIKVMGNLPNTGFVFNPADEFAVPDADIRMLDNTIQLFIPNASNFQYTIYLSANDSVVVDFSAELTKIPCDLSYYLPLEGTFDTSKLELQEVSSLQFLGVLEP